MFVRRRANTPSKVVTKYTLQDRTECCKLNRSTTPTSQGSLTAAGAPPVVAAAVAVRVLGYFDYYEAPPSRSRVFSAAPLAHPGDDEDVSLPLLGVCNK